MIKILKEKTVLKKLNEVQAKASARLMSLNMILAFANRKIKAAEELNAFDRLGTFTIDSAEELNDSKPYHAGPRGGLTVEKSRTVAMIRIFKDSKDFKIDILNIWRA